MVSGGRFRGVSIVVEEVQSSGFGIVHEPRLNGDDVFGRVVCCGLADSAHRSARVGAARFLPVLEVVVAAGGTSDSCGGVWPSSFPSRSSRRELPARPSVSASRTSSPASEIEEASLVREW